MLNCNKINNLNSLRLKSFSDSDYNDLAFEYEITPLPFQLKHINFLNHPLTIIIIARLCKKVK